MSLKSFACTWVLSIIARSSSSNTDDKEKAIDFFAIILVLFPLSELACSEHGGCTQSD